MQPIVLAGPMASGKSSIARQVAEESGARVLSFGDLVRAEAERRGVVKDRATLQNLGQELFRSLGPLDMSEMLLEGRRGDVIVEGVRHVQVLDALNQLLPDLVFVYLTAPGRVLDERWSARGVPAPRQDATAHSVEAELARLRELATVTIDTSRVDLHRAARIILAAAAR